MRDIWKEVFGDTPSYISLIFDNYYSPDSTLIHQENGEISAILFALDYAFKNKSQLDLNGVYLCGLATLPEHRNKGIMGKMIRDIEAKSRKNHKQILFLIPADEHLREYYKKFGFEDSAELEIIEISGVEKFENDANSESPAKNLHYENLGNENDIKGFNFQIIKGETYIPVKALDCIEQKNHLDAEYGDEYVIQPSRKDINIIIQEKLADSGVILYAEECETVSCVDSEKRIWWLGGEFDKFIKMTMEYLSKHINSDKNILFSTTYSIILSNRREKDSFENWYAIQGRSKIKFEKRIKKYGMVKSLSQSLELTPENISFRLMLD